MNIVFIDKIISYVIMACPLLFYTHKQTRTANVALDIPWHEYELKAKGSKAITCGRTLFSAKVVAHAAARSTRGIPQ